MLRVICLMLGMSKNLANMFFFKCSARGVPVGQQYSNLHILMEERAQLELLKDCLLRVKFTQVS